MVSDRSVHVDFTVCETAWRRVEVPIPGKGGFVTLAFDLPDGMTRDAFSALFEQARRELENEYMRTHQPQVDWNAFAQMVQARIDGVVAEA